MTSDRIITHDYSLSHQENNKILTQWLPGGIEFKFLDTAVINPVAAVAMVEEDSIRNGWLLHPQVGIKHKQQMIDVGARYGEYTLPALAVEEDTHVYAFEKDPRLVRCLRDNLRMNKRFPERCSVINKVVSPIGLTIDDYLFNQISSTPENVSWIKIDVGGQDELNIVNGCYKTIEYYRPINILMHLYGGLAEFSKFTETFLAANQFDCKSVVTELEKEGELICNTLIY